MSKAKGFEKLFEPGRIGQMTIRNRIVMPPMQTNFAAGDGSVSEEIKGYYGARARGGVGLVITEASPVLPGNAYYRPVLATGDKFIPGLSQLAKAIQKHGARAAYQLVDYRTSNTRPGCEPVGPSPSGPRGEVLRAIPESEIADIVAAFAKAAKRVKQAGFDGVEIHGAHRYVFARFLSPAWNKRTDKYGGSLSNRARLLLEVVYAVREEVGKTYPFWCRLNGEETGFPGGFALEEAKQVARMLEEAGVDAIHVSAAHVHVSASRPTFAPFGWSAPLAEGIKHSVNVPVIVAGKMTPEIGERLLREGKADFIAMGRALRADPELPNKLASGKIEDITPCIECNACLEDYRPDYTRVCAVNAAIGREEQYRITPAKKKKNVLVVGGGPAGMEAARVAALRGHKVTLYEKGDKLGGQLLPASVPPLKDILGDLTKYMTAKVNEAGVQVKLKQEVTPELVEKLKPDAVILATGATPAIPPIQGVRGDNVVTAEDVLSGRLQTGKSVAIVGGGEVGCETAEFLAEKGKKVTIVEMLNKLAPELLPRQGWYELIERLKAGGVTMLTGVKVEEITAKGLVAVNKEGKKQAIEAETIVVAAGYRSNAKLSQALQGKVPEIHLAGDCVKPRKILQAVDDGARIARAI